MASVSFVIYFIPESTFLKNFGTSFQLETKHLSPLPSIHPLYNVSEILVVLFQALANSGSQHKKRGGEVLDPAPSKVHDFLVSEMVNISLRTLVFFFT